MNNIISFLQNLFTDIANAIRKKTGKNDEIKVSNLAQEIQSIAMKIVQVQATPSFNTSYDSDANSKHCNTLTFRIGITSLYNIMRDQGLSKYRMIIEMYPSSQEKLEQIIEDYKYNSAFPRSKIYINLLSSSTVPNAYKGDYIDTDNGKVIFTPRSPLVSIKMNNSQQWQLVLLNGKNYFAYDQTYRITFFYV